MMNSPVLNNGESIHAPGSATVAIFQDIGWTVAGTSGDVTPPVVGRPTVNIVAPQTNRIVDGSTLLRQLTRRS